MLCYAVSLVVATLKVRLTPRDLRAMPPALFIRSLKTFNYSIY